LLLVGRWLLVVAGSPPTVAGPRPTGRSRENQTRKGDNLNQLPSTAHNPLPILNCVHPAIPPVFPQWNSGNLLIDLSTRLLQNGDIQKASTRGVSGNVPETSHPFQRVKLAYLNLRNL
jgi:hypothetical protein